MRLCTVRTFQFSFNQFVIGEAIPAQTPQFTVSLTTKRSFFSINPQNDGMRNEALSLARFASSGSTFLSAPLAVQPFEPFLHQKMCRYASTAEKNALIVFSQPGLSQEGNALWACLTVPGSQRTGTTLGTQRRKSSIGDQIGPRTRTSLDERETLKSEKP